ncbi:transmembrane protein 201 isoform X2 [Ambystoma mexicanum]|uniref:transmembrane protein 201 isoform X2 n=1 Tax=Ambystoma mexicanum TaxID=8296 RepID=UPI0037E80B8A
MERVRSLIAACPSSGLAVGFTACVGGVLLYRAARRRRPTHVQVNCWFCNQDTVVPYGNRNCWDCPNCEQYNGFQENGDYNKPIPAQFMENLNHVVSGETSFCDVAKPQQWVNSHLLLCKKCCNNQTAKVRQLASFQPRDEDCYDEEIEVYKHHLEQTYKLCRPCQAAVEYYIKHQNRQLRAHLLNYQLKRRDADKTYMKNVSAAYTGTTPAYVVLLRILSFLVCAFLVALAFYGSINPFSSWTVNPSSPPSLVPEGNETAPTMEAPSNDTSKEASSWQELLHFVPDDALENISDAWDYGQNNQLGVACFGLVICLLAAILAGRIRLRRIDAFASFLWVLVMGLHLMEWYLQVDSPAWMDTLKLGFASLCCLVGFAAAVATRKPSVQRRGRPRRYLSGDSLAPFQNVGEIDSSSLSTFVLTPPSMLQMMNQQVYRSHRRASPSSLRGRLHRALSLGTIPSLARADSGYLFSGSRPLSRVMQCRESPGSGQTKSFVAGQSIYSEISRRKEDSSSHSSNCPVDTTTNGCLDDSGGWQGYFGKHFFRGLLAVSLAVNATFTSAYLYQALR